mmetsp:Transcript_8301/g.23896  ORF Transcript_8301/g.23896 Transcript_8301/m.23896 type:complete len:323 (-) Transcript_8301:78-1046(-)
MLDRGSWTKSWETTGLSVYPRTPLSGPSAAFFRTALMSSPVHAFWVRKVKSTMETSGVGTRTAIPVNLPLSSGMTFPTALAAPVEAGMRLFKAERPARQSLPPLAGPSTTSWLAVPAWMVVIRPSTIPNSSLRTFASGARQLVVHEALLRTVAPLYSVWLTPITYMGVSSLGGAEMMTRLAPPFRWASAFSLVVKTPVDSQTVSAPTLPHGMSAGLRSAKNLTRVVPITRQSPSTLTSSGYIPCTESCWNWYAAYSMVRNGSLMPTTVASGLSRAARMTRRPMRPNPLIPRLVGMIAGALFCACFACCLCGRCVKSVRFAFL